MALKIVAALLALVLVAVSGVVGFVVVKKIVGGSKAFSITGKVSRLSEDLNLVKVDTQAVGVEAETIYYSAGTFEGGSYDGYKRYVAVQESIGPGGPTTYLFASKDSKTFILDGDPALASKYAATDYRNPFYRLNTSKVTHVKKLDTFHDQTIKLDGTFALYRTELPSSIRSLGVLDSSGYETFENILLTDFSNYKNLPFSNSNLTLYSAPHEKSKYVSAIPPEERKKQNIKDTYFDGTTLVFAVDPSGLAYSYNLTTEEAIAKYEVGHAKYEKDMETYEKALKAHDQNPTAPWPKSPEYVPYPSLGFKSANVSPKQNLYTTYSVAIPGYCGVDSDTKVVTGISQSDLTSIGKADGISIYAPSNKTHDLIWLSYDLKTNISDEMWKAANPSTVKPTLPEYAAKIPIIFLKDFWNRWVIVGEYDYLLAGGCGKPVVYLYPTTPTEVDVKLTAPIAFTSSLPTYNDGWKVTAAPDGTLIDLRPALTNCDKLPTGPSFDYAPGACKTSTYPYLYWSGNVLDKTYEKPRGGWFVAREELTSFMQNKLKEVGLNQRESFDMLSFWLPRMLSEGTPYYRVSFLTASEVNSLAPMRITPAPDTVFRVFLDFEGLSSKPEGEIPPQTIKPLQRAGFTLVEWGGLLR